MPSREQRLQLAKSIRRKMKKHFGGVMLGRDEAQQIIRALEDKRAPQQHISRAHYRPRE